MYIRKIVLVVLAVLKATYFCLFLKITFIRKTNYCQRTVQLWSSNPNVIDEPGRVSQIRSNVGICPMMSLWEGICGASMSAS